MTTKHEVLLSWRFYKPSGLMERLLCRITGLTYWMVVAEVDFMDDNDTTCILNTKEQYRLIQSKALDRSFKDCPYTCTMTHYAKYLVTDDQTVLNTYNGLRDDKVSYRSLILSYILNDTKHRPMCTDPLYRFFNYKPHCWRDRTPDAALAFIKERLQ